ncbi:MAG TPA: MerR family transcriptional regulator [Chloroflexota bacterium]
MDQQLYRSGQFAEKTGVSIRTLRYYDKVGLLSPAQRTDAGYRLYSDEDLVRLQQILALKFLGFSLEEIKVCLQSVPRGLQEALAEQRSMAQEWRRRLDLVIQALAEAEQLLQANQCDWESMVHVIRAIQMEQNQDWRQKYFNEEQLKTMEELGRKAAAAREGATLPARGPWTEADQLRVNERYDAHYAGVKRLVAAGAGPGDPEAQALAGNALQLIYEFTGGSPQVEAGVRAWWQNHDTLPAEQKVFQPRLTAEEAEYLERAKEIARPQWQPSGA